jgi:hypothetical protein
MAKTRRRRGSARERPLPRSLARSQCLANWLITFDNLAILFAAAPAPAEKDACCVADATAKQEGKPGCGFG